MPLAGCQFVPSYSVEVSSEMTAERWLVRWIISYGGARQFARTYSRANWDVGKVSQVVMALWDLSVEQKCIQNPLQY